MLNTLRRFKFYLKYYCTNHVVNHIPFHAIRMFWYRRVVGMKIGCGTQIWLGCRFVGDVVEQIEIGENTVLASDVVINVSISAPVRIGSFVTISHGVQLITGQHDCQDPRFSGRYGVITVGDYAWISTRALVLQGVTIGEGGVVGAGSVVSQEVKPWGIVVGNPARHVGTRVKPEKAPAPLSNPPLFC